MPWWKFKGSVLVSSGGGTSSALVEVQRQCPSE